RSTTDAHPPPARARGARARAPRGAALPLARAAGPPPGRSGRRPAGGLAPLRGAAGVRGGAAGGRAQVPLAEAAQAPHRLRLPALAPASGGRRGGCWRSGAARRRAWRGERQGAVCAGRRRCVEQNAGGALRVQQLQPRAAGGRGGGPGRAGRGCLLGHWRRQVALLPVPAPALQYWISIVVTPLISLMMNQVSKFNATVGATDGAPRACFLGSMQVDRHMESEVLHGAYTMVYVTPEKLMSGFLERLGPLRDAGRLSLIAIDEAHCISEWGHDFRPEYRQLRSIREKLPGVPLVALTATASPEVQRDIIGQLCLRDPQVSLYTFDRPNLALACTRKQGKKADFKRIAEQVAGAGSTIVYVPTRDAADELAEFLAGALRPAGRTAASYHAGKGPVEREKAHLDFLSGRTDVLVATIAFGMGIDKPDIRRILHYGAPKTVEEYLQQVGRAGRDGLKANCELVFSDQDFNNYSSDFYVGGLPPDQQEHQLRSTDALREFASGCHCRRAWLLKYFGEEPSFGQRCGTCDTCVQGADHADDLRRDFRAPARQIFEAVAAVESSPQSTTTLLAIIAGSWKPKVPRQGDRGLKEAMGRIQAMRQGLPTHFCQRDFVKELLQALCSEGFLERRSETMSSGRGNRRWDVYVRTEKGRAAHEQGGEVPLVVPQSVRQAEEAERKRTERARRELERSGVELQKVPVEEVDRGEGPTLSAHLRWTKRLKDYRKMGETERAEKLEELLERIRRWRDGVAEGLKVAPSALLSEKMLLDLVYTQPTSAEALRSVGLRLAGVEELAQLIRDAVDDLDGRSDSDQLQEGERGGAAAAMVLPEGLCTFPRWEKAVAGPGKDGVEQAWVGRYNRWASGEHLQAIAMDGGKSGAALLIRSVLRNMFTAVTHGKPVDFARLISESGSCPPTEEEWSRIEAAASASGQDVDAHGYRSSSVVSSILSDGQHGRLGKEEWYLRVQWWELLKRVKCPISFDGGHAASA
ncbi:unnamed protein product, partial [Prorocentrum cordatum]